MAGLRYPIWHTACDHINMRHQFSAPGSHNKATEYLKLQSLSLHYSTARQHHPKLKYLVHALVKYIQNFHQSDTVPVSPVYVIVYYCILIFMYCVLVCYNWNVLLHVCYVSSGSRNRAQCIWAVWCNQWEPAMVPREECTSKDLPLFELESPWSRRCCVVYWCVCHCVPLYTDAYLVIGVQRVRCYPFQNHQFNGRNILDPVFMKPLHSANDFKLPRDRESLEYGRVLLFTPPLPPSTPPSSPFVSCILLCTLVYSCVLLCTLVYSCVL